MTQHFDLTNHLLVATPQMGDPLFEQTVILICAHDDDGVMGLVINKSMPVSLADILAQNGQLALPAHTRALDIPIAWGGPTNTERGFVLYTSKKRWPLSYAVSDELTVSTSYSMLEEMARGQGPQQAFVCVGCARWSPDQLARELRTNDWLTLPARSALVFDCPMDQRWGMSSFLMGFDMRALSDHVGHA